MNELEAINIMLDAIYQQSVVTLSDADVDVSDALRVLRHTSKTIQQKGWSFNTNADQTLLPDVDGFLILPSNALKVSIAENSSSSFKVTQRGKKLYNKDNNTFIFEDSIKVDLTLDLDFEDLPFIAQHYITLEAARTFQANKLGSIDKGRIQAQEVKEAKKDFKEAEGEVESYNMLDASDLSTLTRRL